MASILITGAGGFIGTHLARALVERGERVTGLVRNPPHAEPLRTMGVEPTVGDVTDQETLRGAVAGKQVVYHLAGRTSGLRQREFMEVNAEGVRNLLEVVAQQAEPPVVVSVSSLAAAGPSPRGRLRVPGDPYCPVSFYGRSKRAGEAIAEQFADRVPITVVRPSIVFGPGDRLALPLFAVPDRWRVHLVPGYLPNRFSMIHVADLVELLIRAAERGKRLECDTPGRTSRPGYYFAAGDEHPTYYELGRLLAKALGHRVRVIPVATVGVWITALMNELAHGLLGRKVDINLDKAREALAGSWACSVESTYADLGYRPPRSLLERLTETAAWYRAEGWM
jgi:nucleoside-diphosphate-sugar epimerase